MRQFFRRHLYIYIVFEPAQRYSHCISSQLKLTQEAQVVAREEPYFANAILKNCDTFYAHTKGKTAIFGGIIANFAQHFGMHHARSQYFQPATILAEAATRSIADRAINIYLGAWFREWEVA